MPIKAYIEIRGLAARAMQGGEIGRVFRQAVARAMRDAAEYWRDVIQPGHFQTSAVKKYGYQPRTRMYMLRKARLYHHQRPLEFTGDSKRAILGAKRRPQVKVTGTTAKAQLRIVAPRYFFQYNPMHARPIYKCAELVRMTPEEMWMLARFVDLRIGHYMRVLNEGIVRRRRIA